MVSSGVTAATFCVTQSESKNCQRRRLVLYSDLDGTLIGDTVKLLGFNRHWKENEEPEGSVLCYNTARCILAYRKLLTREAG